MAPGRHGRRQGAVLVDERHRPRWESRTVARWQHHQVELDPGAELGGDPVVGRPLGQVVHEQVGHRPQRANQRLGGLGRPTGNAPRRRDGRRGRGPGRTARHPAAGDRAPELEPPPPSSPSTAATRASSVGVPGQVGPQLVDEGAHSSSRRRGLEIFPVPVLGSSSSTVTCLGALKRARRPAPTDQLGAGRRPRRSDTKRPAPRPTARRPSRRPRPLAPPDGRAGRLDLHRRDVLAAGDDEVLPAVDDGDVALGIDDGQVAGAQPATGQRQRRSPRAAPSSRS